jgi:hypothetical protein
MEAEEHFYFDDPSVGPTDGRTTLDEVNYYFVGNGHITAAIQICLSGSGTALGLLIMHPEIFGPKRNAFTFDPESGLAKTSLRIYGQGFDIAPTAANLDSEWDELSQVPVVRGKWGNDNIIVNERFYCPDRNKPRLIREIRLENLSAESLSVSLQTGVLSQSVEKNLTLLPQSGETCYLEYRLLGDKPKLSVAFDWTKSAQPQANAVSYWNDVLSFQSDSPLLNRLLTAARNQLQANIAHSGRLDASIWQYNLEWVRDQSMVVIGLTVSGQFELAGTLLDRMLSQFVTDQGDTIDSSRERPTAEVELDQNGELLLALRTYVDWTGDLSLLKKHWQKVRATAEFPLRGVFRHHDAALLHNRREFWERHALHGIEEGMELMYQFFVSLGLSSTAYLAQLLDYRDEAEKWQIAAQNIKKALLFHPKYTLIDNGHFIKRRKMNGDIQTEVHVREDSLLPKGIPLLEDGPHYLNPDSSASLPIAFEFIDPKGDLARKTMQQIELLWNQRWDSGGYGRYNATSEPDSPGPWPFASLFVARAYLEMGESEKVWRILNWLDEIPGAKSGAWFEFHGPRPIPPYPQIGIIPWTWSELLILFVHHMLGVRPSRDKLLLRPRFLDGVHEKVVSLRMRDIRLNMHLKKADESEETGFWIDEQFYPYKENGVTIDMPRSDLNVRALIP